MRLRIPAFTRDKSQEISTHVVQGPTGIAVEPSRRVEAASWISCGVLVAVPLDVSDSALGQAVVSAMALALEVPKPVRGDGMERAAALAGTPRAIGCSSATAVRRDALIADVDWDSETRLRILPMEREGGGHASVNGLVEFADANDPQEIGRAIRRAWSGVPRREK